MSEVAPTSNPVARRLSQALHIAMKHLRHDHDCGSSSFGSDGKRSCGCGKTQDALRILDLLGENDWAAISKGEVLPVEPPDALERVIAREDPQTIIDHWRRNGHDDAWLISRLQPQPPTEDLWGDGTRELMIELRDWMKGRMPCNAGACCDELRNWIARVDGEIANHSPRASVMKSVGKSASHAVTCAKFPDPHDEREPKGPCTCGAEQSHETPASQSEDVTKPRYLPK